MKGEVWPNRTIFNQFMGPPDSCDICNGRGWYDREESDPDLSEWYYEVFCECPCGVERQRIESK